jgi:lipoprotein-releasing system permease protein
MGPSFYIAARFITSRKKSLFFSMLGVICGVAFFICTQAQTRGFEKFFIQTVLGSSGAIVISDRFQPRYTQFEKVREGELVAGSGQDLRKYYEGITDPYRIMRVARTFSNVAGAAPVVRGSSTASSGFQKEIVRLEGIDLRYHLQATSLRDQIIFGSLDDFRDHPYAVMFGSLLADKLQIKVGDTITLSGSPENRSFTVAAIFRSGVNVVDETRGYVHIKTAQSLLGKPSDASIIVVRLRDADRAPVLAKEFERLFNHRARSWQERERGNLQIFSTLRLSAAITVSLIILLAGFGIFNVLTLTVLDKLKEIAILRSMGYHRGDISAIFLWQGVIIAVLGSIFGCALGALLTYGISLIPLRVRGIIYADHFIVDWSWEHYAYGTAIAFTAVLIASYFPARRAAAVPPVDILRGAGQ